MTTAKIRSTSDNMKRLYAQIERNIAARTDYLATLGAYMLHNDIQRGIQHGGSRKTFNSILGYGTGASAASIYRVLSNGDSNYEEAVARFTSKVEGVGEKNYAGRTLSELIFPEYKPTPEEGKIKSSFASMSLIMAFWEYGHHNKITRRYESVPILSWTAFMMWRRMPSQYQNILSSEF